MDRIRAWMHIAADRAIVRRALATCVVVGGILTLINQGPALLQGQMSTGTVWQIALTLLIPYLVTTASSVAVIQRHRRAGRAEFHLLEREIEAINKFPDENPNPVLRVATNGRLMYANAASRPITTALGVTIGDGVPAELFGELREAAAASAATRCAWAA